MKYYDHTSAPRLEPGPRLNIQDPLGLTGSRDIRDTPPPRPSDRIPVATICVRASDSASPEVIAAASELAKAVIASDDLLP